MPISNFESVRPLVQGMSLGWFNDDKAFIGKRIAPIVPVKKSSEYYPIYGKENLIIPPGNGLRAPGTEPERVSWTWSTTPYTTTEHALVGFIDDRDYALADTELQVWETTTQGLSERLKLIHEKIAADLFFNTATYSSYTAALSGTDRWDNASSDPRVQTNIATASISLNGLCLPDQVTLYVGWEVFAALRTNVTLRNSFQYTTPPSALTAEQIATALGIKEVVPGYAVYNSAGTLTRLWGKYALFAYTPSAPTIKTPASGYTFALNGGQPTLKGYRDEAKVSDAIRGTMDYDVKCVSASSGYLFSTVVS